MDILEELYRRMKAMSAMLCRPLREGSVELYRRWLGQTPEPTSVSASAWLDDWVALGRSIEGTNSGGPTAAEVLSADRDRLEPR